VEVGFLLFRVGAFLGLLAITSVCGAFPLLLRRLVVSSERRDRLLSLGNAFAGGLFLSGGFVHLLGEAADTFEHEVGEGVYQEFPFALVLCPFGFALAFFVEKVIFLRDQNIVAIDYDNNSNKPYGSFGTPQEEEHHHDHSVVHIEHHHEHKPEESGHHEHHAHFLEVNGGTNPLMPYILIAVLSLHSVIAGIAVGIQEDLTSAVPIFVALISHKWIEAFALGVSLLRANKPVFLFFKFLAVFSSMGPLGLVIGSTLYVFLEGDAGTVITALLTATASGTFIYVAIVDILLEEFTSARDKYLKFALAVGGFAAMTCLLFAFPHEHDSDEPGHSH